MAEKPQQQTLSVRISDSLRRRLERARQLMVSKTGEPVSTSEIAKQFLESARDTRLELVDLLAEPTESLLQIRRKGDAGLPMSRTEWTVLAHFVRQGVEAASAHVPNLVSRDSLVAVLDAFLAVYVLRAEADPQLDAYYLGNLPAEFRPSTGRRSSKAVVPDPNAVRRAVEETRRRADDFTASSQPLLAARNLYSLIEGERLPGASDLSQALRPLWASLWRLAARGHYAQTLRPVRDAVLDREAAYQPPIPSVTEGSFTLHFARGAATEFSVLLALPPARGVHYPVSGYPRINEFLAMVAALSAVAPTSSWSGAYFIGGTSETQLGRGTDVWFRAHDNGITLSFSRDDWMSVGRLFERAWTLPDVRRAWNALTTEYGEL